MIESLVQYNGLSELLDQDLSSYEYFHSLPESFQKKIESRDIREFNEMQAYVQTLYQKQDPHVE